MAIFAALFALFAFYSHTLVEQYALAVSGDGGELMAVAVGWELVPQLWPLFVAAMVLASGLTAWVVRRFGCPTVPRNRP